MILGYPRILYNFSRFIQRKSINCESTFVKKRLFRHLKKTTGTFVKLQSRKEKTFTLDILIEKKILYLAN